ncbi:hypothetical protein B7723_00110 [Streptococcus oralis subsp. oralis]|jgi:hypothetical protein|uniref:hypothetical protein n=1 Tax=Streptococcus oralis TaxID=1303 RepID=UPI000A115C71|nr:hypothetical protein [Streptococcus oralis]ORO50768.1 hypothetical protein B7723_00110 [Streptococcus oralis subsp. oralis]
MNAKRKQRKSKEKIEQIPKDVVAYYLPSPNGAKKIYFTRDTILLMYHLIRLRYFSREMILDQYYILTGKELNNRTLYSFIGNSRMPLSHFEDNYRIGKTKFLYVPKYFADWLLDIIHEIPGLTELTKVTEFKGSHYSLKTNKMIGGKDGIRKIHLHDYHTRRLALKIGRRIVEQCTDLSPRELNITYFFPFNRKLISLVPDAVIFVRGQRYLIEYDRNTEPHFKLLGKIMGYFQMKYYRGDTIFFVFDNISEPKDNLLHVRIVNFIDNLYTVPFGDSGFSYYEKTQENNVTLFALPEVNALSQITEAIMHDIVIDERQENERLLEKCITERIIPYDIVLVELVKDNDSPFSLFLTYIDDFYDEVKMPLVRLSYGDVSNHDYFEKLYERYKDEYERVGLVFSSEITKQYYQIPHNDFFISLYIR